MWQDKVLAILFALLVVLCTIWAVQRLDPSVLRASWPEAPRPQEIELTAGEVSSLRHVGIPW